MLFKILLILAFILQLASTSIAIKLTKRTTFNSAWILFATAMIIVNAQLVYELINIFKTKHINYNDFMLWSTLIVSLCLSIGVFFVEKIITYVEAVVRYRQIYEKKVIISILRAEERERARIAKELHDGLGPLLSSASMSLSYITKEDSPTSTKKEMLEGVANVIDESIKSVREISNNLSPNTLNSFGLIRAVNNFINKLTLPPYITINFTTNIKKDRYNKDTEIIVYRICCELINNALKHSGCNTIDLSITGNKKSLSLLHKDNGKGFDYNATIASDSKGLGLSNIVSRVDYVGGKLTVESTPDSGTLTSIIIPITK